MDNTILVERERCQPALRRLARERGIEPVDLVATAISSTATFAEAADRLGVSTVTLKRWRDRLGIKVVTKVEAPCGL